MRYNKYYYENFSIDILFDDDNPRYVLSLDGTDDIITDIVNAEPFTLSIDEFKDKQLVEKLLHIDALTERQGKIGLAIPIFIEKETDILKSLSHNVAISISNRIIEHKNKIYEIISKINNGFSKEINLYHILCGSIFDGQLFDYLEENKLVTTSKPHESGLDYLIIMYEQSKRIEDYSDKLLCSYNRLMGDNGGFVSFGDNMGDRKDLYRYYRLKEADRLDDDTLKYVKYEPDVIIDKFNNLLNGNRIEDEYLEIFEYFDYVKNGVVSVPVYGESCGEVIDELYSYILELIGDKLEEALCDIEQRKDLISVSHGVNSKDIANEIYHLIFGEINELLVEHHIVAQPIYVNGEGRYLKCFETI